MTKSICIYIIYKMDAPPTSSEWFCEKKFGDGGYRSPYLSHAKRALYHLSYVPTLTF